MGGVGGVAVVKGVPFSHVNVVFCLFASASQQLNTVNTCLIVNMYMTGECTDIYYICKTGRYEDAVCDVVRE